MREFVFKYVMHSQASYQDVWLVPGFCDPLLITLNPTEYQTHRLTEQNSALSNLQANYDFTRSVSQSGCPAVSSEFRCDCTFKNLLSQQIRPRKLWNYTTAKNFQPKAALTIFTDAASAVTAVTKNSLYPIMMRLRQTRCQLLWTWATHCEYSQAGEKAVRAQSTRSTGGEELEVNSVLAWMRACGRCRAAAAAAAEARQGRARQATLLPLRACEEFASKSTKRHSKVILLITCWKNKTYESCTTPTEKLSWEVMFPNQQTMRLIYAALFSAEVTKCAVPLAHMWFFFPSSFRPTSDANICTYFSS